MCSISVAPSHSPRLSMPAPFRQRLALSFFLSLLSVLFCSVPVLSFQPVLSINFCPVRSFRFSFPRVPPLVLHPLSSCCPPCCAVCPVHLSLLLRHLAVSLRSRCDIVSIMLLYLLTASHTQVAHGGWTGAMSKKQLWCQPGGWTQRCRAFKTAHRL
jgi:hypothetical protein